MRTLHDELQKLFVGKGGRYEWTETSWADFIAGNFGGAGSPGPPGPQGDPGATGATGPQGEQGMFWMGAWSALTLYQVDDAVEHNGSSYIATILNQASEPPSGDWDLVSSKGDTGGTGADGAPGATGATGAAGPAGPAGAEGPPGEDGAVGPQGSTGPQGATGGTGAPGGTGPTGATGQMGFPGQDGEPGEDGPLGPPGPSGPAGAAGSTGPAGATGLGIPGQDGEDGVSDWVPGPDSITKMPGFPGGTTTFLRADRTFAAPPGGAGATWTEVEIDFGTNPVFEKSFTITDAAAGPTSKIIALPSGKVASGRVGNDDMLWDGLLIAAITGTGNFIVFAVAKPGPVVGKRTIQYSIA